jgi:hypothetical protein
VSVPKVAPLAKLGRDGIHSFSRTVFAFVLAFRGTGGALRQAMYTEYRFVEFWSGVVIAGWGLWNMVDPHQLTSIPQYHLVNDIFPEAVIEVAAVFAGTYQVAAVVEGRGRPRVTAAFASSWFYSFFVYSFLSSTPEPAGIMFTVGWAGANVFATIRLIQGAR